MSAVILAEKQRKKRKTLSPAQKEALERNAFKKGKSGNPGGQQKGVVYVSEAYKRLGSLPESEFEQYEPRGKIESSVKRALMRADSDDAQAAHLALKEIADRTEGKPEQKKTVQENRTITVIFERPEFTNYADNNSDSAPGAGEDITRVEALQRAGLRETLREIAIGPVPVDRDGS